MKDIKEQKKKTLLQKTKYFTPCFDFISSNYPSSADKVFGRIWKYANENNGVCGIYIKTIAEEIGLSKRTVERAIHILEDGNLITDTIIGKGYVHKYIINEEEANRQHNDWMKSKMRNEIRNGILGWVYLIMAENDLYKIGKARDILKRLNPFKINLPMAWELLYSFKCNDYTKAEKYLHEKFSEKRVRGEWFRLLPEDVEYITSIGDFSL